MVEATEETGGFVVCLGDSEPPMYVLQHPEQDDHPFPIVVSPSRLRPRHVSRVWAGKGG